MVERERERQPGRMTLWEKARVSNISVGSALALEGICTGFLLPRYKYAYLYRVTRRRS